MFCISGDFFVPLLVEIKKMLYLCSLLKVTHYTRTIYAQYTHYSRTIDAQ